MEQVPDPSHLTPGQLAMWILAIVVTALITRGTFRKSNTGGSESSTLTVPTEGDGPDAQINTAGMSPSLIAALTAVSNNLTDSMAKNADHEKRITALDDEIRRMGGELKRAYGELRIVHQWIEDGKPPPDPVWPEWLKRS